MELRRFQVIVKKNNFVNQFIKRLSFWFFDFLFTIVSLQFSFILLTPFLFHQYYSIGFQLFYFLLSNIFLLFFKTYNIKLFSFDLRSILTLLIFSLTSNSFLFILNTYIYNYESLKIFLINSLILFILLFIYRILILFILNILSFKRNELREPVAIYGAGSAGIQLIAALQKSKEYKPVSIFDDSKHIQGLRVSNLIVQCPSKLFKNNASFPFSKILFAIPSLNIVARTNIIRNLTKKHFSVLILPSYPELISKGGLLESLHPPDLSELLGRKKVDTSLPEINKKFFGKNILVTGAGGSIGSELCRHIISLSPSKLIIIDSSEYSLYKISNEIESYCLNTTIIFIPILCSVIDKKHIDNIIENNNIYAVFHAAAYKHVPILESNEVVGAKNNIFGTLNLAESAAKYNVQNFVLISTDKAVRPTNLMGASKRFSELIIQDIQIRHPYLNYSIVRFGNVLGSSGSVVPLFQKQISNGGPITITHKDVTRYFMTIPEASQLVLLAGCFSNDGKVFVLDMGEPVKITDLAYRMVAMAGLTIKDSKNPNGDIEINYTNLRPGEKLHEELFMGNDLQSTPHPKILIAKEPFIENKKLQNYITELSKAINNLNNKKVRVLLSEIIDGYSI